MLHLQKHACINILFLSTHKKTESKIEAAYLVTQHLNLLRKRIKAHNLLLQNVDSKVATIFLQLNLDKRTFLKTLPKIIV